MVMSKKIVIQVNFNCGRIKKGERITIDADENGIPLNKFWRRRLSDSAIDQCIEVINDQGE